MRYYFESRVFYVCSSEELSNSGFPHSFPIYPSCGVLLQMEPKEIKGMNQLRLKPWFVMWTDTQGPIRQRCQCGIQYCLYVVEMYWAEPEHLWHRLGRLSLRAHLTKFSLRSWHCSELLRVSRASSGFPGPATAATSPAADGFATHTTAASSTSKQC